MNPRSHDIPADAPILIVPYMWIGDFVRCHTVVRVLKARFPDAPVDMLATSNVAPLADYLPGVRKSVVFDLPRKRLALWKHRVLAARLKAEGYGRALMMPRTWKSALAPWLAGIPERTGFVGELRFGVLNDIRGGEKALPRMVDRCAALAGPKGAPLPADWPKPRIVVPGSEIIKWRQSLGLGGDGRRAIALAPGAVGPSKRWSYYAEAAKSLTQQGFSVWVAGGPGERQAAAAIVAENPSHIRDLTGTDLRQAILALAAADAVLSNDSGLLHVAAAIGTPTVGIFGPTSPWHWAPLNPIAEVLETKTQVDCRPCHKPVCRMVHHRCMRDIDTARVVDAVVRAMAT
jgi:heptosyltransferase II